MIGKFTSSGTDIENETFEIYEKIFKLMSHSFLYLVKCHNFVPAILQNYDAFNRGRNRAFKQNNYSLHPAATAVGSTTNELQICFLLGQQLPVEIHNPEQVDPYSYPLENRPLFARAVKTADDQVYISGTASIVGHESVYINDVILQLHQTIKNIQTVAGLSLDQFEYIIYVKRPADVKIIKSIFPYPAKYIVCDICRDELLIEIEATSKHGKDLTSLYA